MKNLWADTSVWYNRFSTGKLTVSVVWILAPFDNDFLARRIHMCIFLTLVHTCCFLSNGLWIMVQLCWVSCQSIIIHLNIFFLAGGTSIFKSGCSLKGGALQDLISQQKGCLRYERQVGEQETKRLRKKRQTALCTNDALEWWTWSSRGDLNLCWCCIVACWPFWTLTPKPAGKRVRSPQQLVRCCWFHHVSEFSLLAKDFSEVTFHYKGWPLKKKKKKQNPTKTSKEKHLTTGKTVALLHESS